LEKIIMITPNQEANQYLLPCLKLLFPECVIESSAVKVINNTDIFMFDDNIRIVQIKGEGDRPCQDSAA